MNNIPTTESVYSYDHLYEYVIQTAREKELSNTETALSMTRDFIRRGLISDEPTVHCLTICRMMIDLNLELDDRELDILLAAAICHALPHARSDRELNDLLTGNYGLDPEICQAILIANASEKASDQDLSACYDRIMHNKLALLLTLCDRGNMVEQLYHMNSWQVRKFIYETREYYIPMCIYGKEHYHELLSPIGILAEKMKNLTDVSEILMMRFESRETELCHEILALKEENATIRGILEKYGTKEI